MREIKRTTGLVLWHAVDQHLHVIALPSAHEQRGLSAERAGRHDRHPRHRAQGVGDGADTLGAQGGPREHGDGGRHRRGRDRQSLGGDHDRAQARGVGGLLGAQQHRGDAERRQNEDTSHASDLLRWGIICGAP